MNPPLVIRTGSIPVRPEIPPPLDNTARTGPMRCYRCGEIIPTPVPLGRGESMGGGVQMFLRTSNSTIIALLHANCAQGDAHVRP